ncbi:hypothetical protein ACOMHN_000304 [Nucella lapillus]
MKKQEQELLRALTLPEHFGHQSTFQNEADLNFTHTAMFSSLEVEQYQMTVIGARPRHYLPSVMKPSITAIPVTSPHLRPVSDSQVRYVCTLVARGREARGLMRCEH